MAEPNECATLAEIINLASGGVVDFLFHDLVPEMTPVQKGGCLRMNCKVQWRISCRILNDPLQPAS